MTNLTHASWVLTGGQLYKLFSFSRTFMVNPPINFEKNCLENIVIKHAVIVECISIWCEKFRLGKYERVNQRGIWIMRMRKVQWVCPWLVPAMGYQQCVKLTVLSFNLENKTQVNCRIFFGGWGGRGCQLHCCGLNFKHMNNLLIKYQTNSISNNSIDRSTWSCSFNSYLRG